MRKCKTVATSAVLVFLILVSSAMAGEEKSKGEFSFLREEEVVYTPAGHRQDIDESPSAITVITRNQIENTHCTDVVCLLRQVPEVDVMRILPMHTVVGARAMTSEVGNRTLLLIDGREVGRDLFGLPDWQMLPVHLEDIERIEVIRGPLSALYGANAHSIVVSIATRRPGDNTAEVFLGGGELDRNSLHLRVGRRFGNWSLELSGGMDTAANWEYPEEREREVERIRLRLTREAGDLATDIQLDLVVPEGTLQTTPFPLPLTDMWAGHFFCSQRINFFKAHVWAGFWDITSTPDLVLAASGFLLGQFDPAHFSNIAVDVEPKVELEPFDGNLLIVGANYRLVMIESDETLPTSEKQHRLGFFLHDEQRLGENLLITFSLRFDRNGVTPTAFSPRVAGVCRFTEEQSLRLAFGMAFSKPSFFNTSLHFNNIKTYPGAIPGLEEFFLSSFGNSEIDNEKVTSFEIGYRGQFLDRRLAVEADAFYNQYRNIIAFDMGGFYTDMFGIPDFTRSWMGWTNRGGEVDSLGGSASVTYRIRNTLRVNANYTYRHSWYNSAALINWSEEGEEGDPIKWERAHMANLSISYVPEQGLRLGLSLHGDSACERPVRLHGMLFGEETFMTLPARVFAGGFLALRFRPAFLGSGWVEVGLRAYNLLNNPFRDTASVTRFDGKGIGGELLARRVILFFKGSI